MGRLIIHVQADSLAHKYGVKAGMRLSALNGNENFDIIDYLQASACPIISLGFESGQQIEIENSFDAPIGISFESATVDNVMKCANNCIFCFISQLPEGMRESLYVRDDDYRLSFLTGNFITLTNASRQTLDRIAENMLSPLYISVHTLDPGLRAYMLGNRNAGDIAGMLEYLAQCNIMLNLQFVLCPGINDGQALASSFEKLLPIIGSIESAACVPVGLTKHRQGLASLRAFAPSEARDAISIIDSYRMKAYELCGRHVFSAADEFYIISGTELPGEAYYEGYPQYENGVGIARSFIDEAKQAAAKLARLRGRGKASAALVTGTLAYPIIKEACALISSKAKGIELEAIAAENRFFGSSITVSGLLAGSDIASAISVSKKADVIVPSSALSDEGLFLDGMGIGELGKITGKRIHVSDASGAELVRTITALRH